jgi:hypothetical protein
LKERCERDGMGCSEEVLARQFRLHLHRGIAYLATPQSIRSIGDLINLVTEDACAGSDRSSEPETRTASPAQQVAGARRGAVRTDSELA